MTTKLNTAQIATLKSHRHDPVTGIIVGNGRTLNALVRRGLACKLDRGLYVITDEGRAAITAID